MSDVQPLRETLHDSPDRVMDLAAMSMQVKEFSEGLFGKYREQATLEPERTNLDDTRESDRLSEMIWTEVKGRRRFFEDHIRTVIFSPEGVTEGDIAELLTGFAIDVGLNVGRLQGSDGAES